MITPRKFIYQCLWIFQAFHIYRNPRMKPPKSTTVCKDFIRLTENFKVSNPDTSQHLSQLWDSENSLPGSWCLATVNGHPVVRLKSVLTHIALYTIHSLGFNKSSLYIKQWTSYKTVTRKGKKEINHMPSAIKQIMLGIMTVIMMTGNDQDNNSNNECGIWQCTTTG